MSKLALFYDQAEKLYVQDGFNLDQIASIMKDGVSRKTLFTWKKDFNWDDKRKNQQTSRYNIQDNALEMLRIATTKFFELPSDKTMKQVETAVKICQKLGVDLHIKEKGEDKKRSAPEDVAKAIRSILRVPEKA